MAYEKCTKKLQAAGVMYPKTCAECGLGPCKDKPVQQFALSHLTDENCDGCGAHTVSIEKIGQHCNGQWFETRKFNCGARIKFVPNFGRVEVDTPCSFTEKAKLAKKKRIAAIESLREHVESLDVDKECKKRMLDAFMYFNVDR